MLLLGIDLGTSSIKVSVVESDTGKTLITAQYPDTESAIISKRPGWAEQAPEMWWEDVQQAILRANSYGKYNPKEIGAIGIAYQMHGLVVVNKQQEVLRPAIIWCDSRAVEIGNNAFNAIGKDRSLSHLLNSPGNFTASKLAWVKNNEPSVYEQIDKIMLPGDFIAMKLTGEMTTSISALSEGIFWDFKEDDLSDDIIGYFDFERSFIPKIQPVFSIHGELKEAVASSLDLKAGIPVTYKSGDQPNNALSLNVLKPGEVAATAGTSGVIYGVSAQLTYDPESRVNTFAHVNYTGDEKRLGVLLCINGTGILNSWTKNNLAKGMDYAAMNSAAQKVDVGSDGLKILPFGNGAERMLNNRMIGAHFHNIDFNIHTQAHIFRAIQEGIAFSFRYGLDIMRENGLNPGIIRAGRANMFLSELFTEAFVNATNVPVELYESDGSAGAAIGAGIGAKVFPSGQEAFDKNKPVRLVEPKISSIYESLYREWESLLEKKIDESVNVE
jgi:xylulokinase